MDTSKKSIRGRLRMRISSPLTGAAVELISKFTHGHSIAEVRLLEAAGNYPAGTKLYVGVDEFVAD
jgi:hypothetical protein